MDYTEINSRVRAVDMTKEDNKIWIAPAVSNSIYELDYNSRRVISLGEFQHKNYFYPYCCVEKYKDKLFFAPQNAEYITVYDTSTCTSSCIKLEQVKNDRKEVYRNTLKFVNCYRKDKKLYLLGFFYPAIISIDMESMEVIYISDWLDEIEKRIDSGDERGYFGGGSFEKDGYIYFACDCSNCLIKLNTANNTTEIIDLECEIDGITDMIFDDEYLWMTGRKEGFGYIYKYSFESKQTEIIYPNERPSKGMHHYKPYWKLINSDEYIWLFPYIAKGAYKINKKSLEITKLAFFKDLNIFKDRFTEPISCYMVKQIEKKVYICTYEGLWIEFDLDTESVEYYEYDIPKDEVMKEVKSKLDDGICYEDSIGLTNFFDFITN